MRCQEELGMMCDVVTSSQHPNGDSMREAIDGRNFVRTPSQPDRKTGLREMGMMHALKKTIESAVREFRPDVIHAASPVLVGLPALHVARKHKLPFVYEVRYLWENASVDRGKWKYDSLPYKGAKGLETILYKKSDAIVAICEALRNEISPRIGKNTSLQVIPNGVESSLFQGKPPEQSVLDKWNLGGKTLLGYIGAFQPYEGLETLFEAMPAIAESIPNAHLMITGGGNALEADLHKLVEAKNLSHLITFTGRVPHEVVKDMYSVVDLMVYPRISTRTTELTTPLKPLEAMALKVPVMLSSTQAMRELVREDTGYTFTPGDTTDLARVATQALGDADERKRRAENARKYVEEERHWPTIVEEYRSIYEGAIAKNRGRA
ncbi:MAG: glycosyltransferase [Myxococcales bacterium]|nr:glycosyltransferase [Myxococcales bacterium]